MTDRDRFYLVINNIEFLKPFWDKDQHVIHIDKLEKRLSIMSSSERNLALFFAALWLNTDIYSINIIDLIASLDFKYRQIISDWVLFPYWP